MAYAIASINILSMFLSVTVLTDLAISIPVGDVTHKYGSLGQKGNGRYETNSYQWWFIFVYLASV